MKPDRTEHTPWRWPYPQSWAQVYAAITALLLGLLVVLFGLDWLYEALAP